jgi:hypothetical protein
MKARKSQQELKPSSRRPVSPVGDSQEDMIFSAVGQALTEWEQLENACAQLFAVLVSTSHKRAYLAPAIRAYGTITSAATRKEMLVNAGEAYFASRPTKAQTFKVEFNQLMQAYIDFASRRNDIAHGLVQRVFLTKRGTRPAAIGIYLTPSFYSARHFKNEQLAYLYTSGDLVFYRQEFTKLMLRVSGLKERLRAKPEKARAQ